jgi:hypothetical protein
MFNVEQITARLATLPDPALQQYAMMHKADPYIMALAMSESKRRKHLRAASQGAPVPEQPKIVDQAVSDMAPPQSPDDAGIASLPTQEMNFADGGIVAFAGGGDTYETPYDRMNRQNREAAARQSPSGPLDAQAAQDQAALARWWDSVKDTSEVAGRAIADVATLVPRGLAGAYDTAVVRPMRAAGINAAYLSPALVPAGVDPASMTPFSDVARSRTTNRGTSPEPGYTRPAMQNDPRLATPATMPAGTAPAATPPAAKAPAGLAAIAPGATAGAAPSVGSAKGLAGEFLDVKSLRGDIDKFTADEAASVDAARKRQGEGKPEGKAYSKYEEMLQAEEAGAGKERDEAKSVAIFKAGLAMMAGASPRALENIGKGAMAGLEEYSGAIKDMKKAAKERQKALADIENARRAEDRDDWKSKQAFEDKADARMAKAREFGVKSIMDITGKDAEISSKIYNTQVEQQGAMARAKLQARTTLDAASIRGAGGGNEDKQTLAELKALQASLSNQLKTEFNKDSRMAINAQLSQVNSAIAKMAGLSTMAPAPGAAGPGGTTTGWGKASVINP